VSVTSNPVHGDLAVIIPGCGGADATAGHVGAVQSVSSSNFVMVQQNPAGTYTWPKSCVSCFLHASSNGGVSDPCSTAASGGGYYCGQSTQFGGGTPNDLYLCQNGVTVSKTPCACGCIVEPAGKNDQCAMPCMSDSGAPHDAGGDAASHDGGNMVGDSGGGATPDASTADSGSPQGGDASDVDSGMWAGNGDTGGGGGCAIGGGANASLFGVGVLAMSLLAHRRRRRRDAVVREHPHA
jgi:hypothetical protein